MKTLIAAFKALIAFLFVGGLFYLIGSFGSADFNLQHWSKEGRAMVAFFGGMIAIAAAGVVFDHFNDDK